MQPERNLVIRLAVGLELLGWNCWVGTGGLADNDMEFSAGDGGSG